MTRKPREWWLLKAKDDAHWECRIYALPRVAETARELSGHPEAFEPIIHVREVMPPSRRLPSGCKRGACGKGGSKKGTK